MTWYTFFKSIHVVTAVIWVGGATMVQAYAFREIRRRHGDLDPEPEEQGRL